MTSFHDKKEEETWVGTFKLVVSESGDPVIYYNGIMPQCMAKKMMDFVYEDCDTMEYSIKDLEPFFEFKPDTTIFIPKDIKIIRM